MSAKKELEAIDSIAGHVNEAKREQLFEEYSCETLRIMIRKTMRESQRIIKNNDASKQRLSELKCNNAFILEMLLCENNTVESLQSANCKLKRDILLERMKKEDVKKHFDEEINLFKQKWNKFQMVYESSPLAVERTQLNNDTKKLNFKLKKVKQDLANLKEAFYKWQDYKKVLDQQLIVKFALHATSWPLKLQSALTLNNSIYNKQAEIESLTNKQVSLLSEIEQIKKQYIVANTAQASERAIPKMDTPGYIDLNVPKDYSSTQIKAECDIIQDLFLRVSTSLSYAPNANKSVSRLALENLGLSVQNIQRNPEPTESAPNDQVTQSAFFARDAAEQNKQSQNDAVDVADASQTELVHPMAVSSDDNHAGANGKKPKVKILESVILEPAQAAEILRQANLNSNFLRLGMTCENSPNQSPPSKRLKESSKDDETDVEQTPIQKMECINDQFNLILSGTVELKETNLEDEIPNEGNDQLHELLNQPEDDQAEDDIQDEQTDEKNINETMTTCPDTQNSHQSQFATLLSKPTNETCVTPKNIMISQENINKSSHQPPLEDLNQTMTTCRDSPQPSQPSEFVTPHSRPLNKSCVTPKDISSQETTSSVYCLDDALYEKFKMTASPQFVYAAKKTLPVKQSLIKNNQNVGIEEDKSKFFTNEPEAKVMTAQAMFKTLPRGDSSPENFDQAEVAKKAEVSSSDGEQDLKQRQNDIMQPTVINYYENGDKNMQSLTTLEPNPGDKMLTLTMDEERQDESMSGDGGEYDFSHYLNSDSTYTLSPKAEEDLSLTGMENKLRTAASLFGFNSTKSKPFGGFSDTKTSETETAEASAGFPFNFAENNNQEKKKKNSFLSLFN